MLSATGAGARFVAWDTNPTKRPSALMPSTLPTKSRKPLGALPWRPAVDTLTRSVVPVARSWTKTSATPLVSPMVPFAWTAVPGATQYVFEFTGANLEFTNPNGALPDLVNGFGGAGGRLLVSGTSLSPELLPSFPPGIYQVRVIGLSPTGDFLGTFSDAVTVVLRASPIAVNATIVAGRGPGWEPEVHLRSESIRNGQLTGQISTRSFLAFPPEFTGGVNVGTGDTTGGGGQQVIGSQASSAGPEQPVTTFSPEGETVVVRTELPTGSDGPSGGNGGSDGNGDAGDGGGDAGGF